MQRDDKYKVIHHDSRQIAYPVSNRFIIPLKYDLMGYPDLVVRDSC